MMLKARALAFSLSLFSVVATVACGSVDDSEEASGSTVGAEQDLRHGVQHCGGFAGLKCGAGLTCVDDPIDSCDPANGGKDCSGLCLDVDKAPKCGGIAGLACPNGLRCVDNPADACDPASGADCMGVCVKAACDPKLAVTATCMPGTQWDQTKCACTAVKASCDTLRCAAGYHCEDKPNGSDVPACVKDNKSDCRDNGCGSGQKCSPCWGVFACIPKGALC
jgi:hypothetical protein